MAQNVIFDGNDIQTDNILISEVNHENIPTKDAVLYALAHANKSSIPFVNYPQRGISLTGKVIGSSIADLDSRLDTFRSYFTDKDSNLDIDYNGTTRRYIATLNALSITRPFGLVHANFVAQFLCTQPFGQNTSTTSAASANNVTTASATYNHTFLGTAPFQLPVITITIDAVTGGTGHLTIKNGANDQGITIVGQTFSATDVIEIDCKNRTVKLDGAEIDFLGAFPEFAPGSQDIEYEDGFTTRTYDINAVYYPMWL